MTPSHGPRHFSPTSRVNGRPNNPTRRFRHPHLLRRLLMPRRRPGNDNVGRITANLMQVEATVTGEADRQVMTSWRMTSR